MHRSPLPWQAQIKKLPLSDGQWRYSRRAHRDDPAQGWKIHVSATILSAPEVLARAAPILQRHDALFKVPGRLELLISLNSGLSKFSQVGKFLTIYPRSTDEAVSLARELHHATRGLAGPRIPFDARYRKGSLVHYRYGTFRRLGKNSAGVIRGPGGKTYLDKRAPAKAIPFWLDDPFNHASKSNGSAGPIGLDYLAFKAKTQRGKGGVYEAVDLSVSPARLVIIKEGRRDGETDSTGKDGYTRIRHEGRVLRLLCKAVIPVPEVFREFTQNRNRYLVLEQIKGRPLISARSVQPPRTSWRLAAKILDQLGFVLARIHAAGWVWRDCKPSHVFVHRGHVRLIDFENACHISEREISSWGSRDYLPPITHKTLQRRTGTREDDYALGIIAFQFLSGTFPPANSRRRASIYRATRCPDWLSSRIENLLQL